MEELTKYLPSGWEEKARELKAMERKREIKNAAELLELNLVYLTVGGSIGETSTILQTTEEKHLTKTAVYHHIQKSGEWLKWMAQEMGKEDGMILPKPEWLGDKTVLLSDGCEVTTNKGTNYLLHYALDLFNFKCRNVEVTEASDGEKL